MAYIKGVQDTGPPTPTGTILLVLGVVLLAIIIFLYFCWRKEQYLRRNPKADALLSAGVPGGIRERREKALRNYNYHKEQQMENTLLPNPNFIPSSCSNSTNSNACKFPFQSSCGGCPSGGIGGSGGGAMIPKQQKGWNYSRYDESYRPSENT